MDDPWGSPWATTDSDKDHKSSSPTKSDLAPPPRAFLSASNSPRIPAALEQSPWGGDEDDFGDWATASDTPSGQGVWRGGWGASSPNLSSTPRDDMLGKASPIAWPGNVATPKPANGSTFRQPSPDPWSSAFSSRRPSNDGNSTPRLVVSAAPPVDRSFEPLGKHELGIEDDSVWEKSDAGDTIEDDTDKKRDIDPSELEDMAGDGKHEAEEPSAGKGTIEETALEQQAAEEQTVGEESIPVTSSPNDVRMSVESAAPSREYRSSTPSHENTDQEDVRQDSPITPIDEEPNPQRPVSRKTSGKVQELVVKFDGLARAASEERVLGSRGRSVSPLSIGRRDPSADAVDFGDFEDASAAEPPLPVETATRQPGQEEHVEAKVAAAPVPPPPEVDGPSAIASPISTFGPLRFSADLNSIGKLFAALGDFPRRGVEVDRDVPDHIISDSFTEISQRKTWYRISRLGSSRRHNAGDDESYRRVAWPTSTVHHDTIKIVRRWMEEDSIAGRVALGGGISKTQKNMFGWDSSAEPVDLDTVFRKKRSHSRSSSLQTIQTSGFPAVGLENPTRISLQGPSHRPSGSAGPIVAASFGWSSSSPNSTGPTCTTSNTQEFPNTSGVLPKPPVSTPQTPSAPGSKRVFRKQVISTQGPVLQPSAAQPGVKTITVDDDDEEWGEMVSSPTTAGPGTKGSASPRLALPVSTTPKKAVVEIQPSGRQVRDDPWGTADFSVFESAPAKPVSHAQAHAADSELVDLPVKGPNTAPNSGTTGTAVPGASGSAKVVGPLFPSPSASPRDIAHPQHDEVAERIIANLPDLSYMLR
ncbi:hypothetical protein VTI74DRAFT_4850 [Chaetomium olivicolor]